MPGSSLIYISLGSNVDPEKHMRKACSELTHQLADAVTSPIYQSPAIGMEGADFLNAVIGGNTFLNPDGVISLLREIESAHGRVRSKNKFSDRTLDLDLLLFGDCTKQNDLTECGTPINLPHPEITEQAYVIQPLADIAPSIKHPLSGLTISALCQQMKTESPACFNVLKKITL